MIVAQKVEGSMYEQARDLPIEAAVSPARLPGCGFEADHDVSQQVPAATGLRPFPEREGEDIRRTGTSAITGVQVSNGGIVHQGDGEFEPTLREFS